jgi:hypothetical protein
MWCVEHTVCCCHCCSVAGHMGASAQPSLILLLLLLPLAVLLLTGCPMHTGQIFVFGSSPYWLGQLQKALLRVSSCTCVSMPITASYCTAPAPTTARQ